ncbi:hypothetical protein IM295_05305 [Enterobacter cloacae complex sp. P14RS]|uniref:phage tailspike protein n=1 Tax=Enterobacter TaxID=547 RepID=UPI0018694515|nr:MULTISPECIES: phage tailspike protein [Enterobacter]MBE3480726.1 hypothetical protein [Enterobacter cloacae complex sp. P14RS]
MADDIQNILVGMPVTPYTLASSFKAIANGTVYIGAKDTDPTVPSNQIQVYVETESGTVIPVSQPLIINSGGYLVYSGQIAKFVVSDEYSMAVYDAVGVQQHYFADVLKYNPNTLRDELAQDDGMKLIGQKVNYGIPVGSSLTQGVMWLFDKIKGYLRVGGSDLEPLDDEKNYWRGLPSRNSWGDPAMIGDYSVSFNRNGASFAVYTTTFGHDCVTYGVASLAGGAGSATGNPDDITSPNAEGYCSFAFGKNVIALGAKSAALCEEVEANSRAAFAAGYFTQARAGFTTDPGGVASDGIGATALGYSTRAAGDGAFAVGRYAQAYGGAIVIGSGINSGNQAVNSSAKSVAIFANSVVPAITAKAAGGGVTDMPFVGVHTLDPKEPLDVAMPNGTNAAFRITGSGGAKIKLQGTSNSDTGLDIASLEWTSTNGGSAVGTLKINMNNGAPSIELSTDGMVALKNVKTLPEISGAPAGTIYKDASNFLKIVV